MQTQLHHREFEQYLRLLVQFNRDGQVDEAVLGGMIGAAFEGILRLLGSFPI